MNSDSADRNHGASRHRALVIAAALVLGFAVRLPGVWWGANFPFGWYGHHVDEYTHLVNAETLINPTLDPRWPPNPYPKGTAVHAAAPLIAARAVQGQLLAPWPSPQVIITTGRIVSVLYGVATILVVYLLALTLLRDLRMAQAAAFIIALGGLHVTQSHFFLSDVQTVFWQCLGSYAIWRAVETDNGDARWLAGAAFCLGVAIGLKLFAAAIPSLLVLAVFKPPRIFRLLQAAAFGLAGFVLVNANSYDLFDIARTLAGTGSRHVREFNRVDGALIYALQLPAILSTPVVFLLIAAVGLAWRRWRQHGTPSQLWAWSLAVILPNIVMAIVLLFGANNFPRHLLPFIPWAAIAAAYALVTLSRSIQRPTVRRTVVALFYAYLAVFVWDGERVFFKDPRNAAATWMRANVAEGTAIWWQGHGWIGEYKHVVFPSQGRPDVLVMELHRANIYLSGMGWKNSMPTNVKQVYGAGTQADLETLQAVFRHTSEYQEVARFKEGYLMPEFRITDALLGNRARNYVGEIVIFRKSS